MKKIDTIWNSLSNLGVKSQHISQIDKPKICIYEDGKNSYSIFSNIIVKKEGNTFSIKNDEKKQFQNEILKIIPECFRQQLIDLLKSDY